MNIKESITKASLLGFFYRFLGIVLEFFIFNTINILLFSYVWKMPYIYAKLLYFFLGFIFFKFGLKLSDLFISRFINSAPVMTAIYQRRKFGFLAGLYFLSYLGTLYTMRDNWFFNYIANSFVFYFIGWIVYKNKVNKMINIIKTNRKSSSF